jgi:hypothetical protein
LKRLPVHLSSEILNLAVESKEKPAIVVAGFARWDAVFGVAAPWLCIARRDKR